MHYYVDGGLTYLNQSRYRAIGKQYQTTKQRGLTVGTLRLSTFTMMENGLSCDVVNLLENGSKISGG